VSYVPTLQISRTAVDVGRDIFALIDFLLGRIVVDVGDVRLVDRVLQLAGRDEIYALGIADFGLGLPRGKHLTAVANG